MVMRRRPTQRERYILADLVRHRRMELGHSQQKIADCLGCSLHWMNDIEQGKVDPTWRDATYLYILLGVDLADFAERVGIEPLKPKEEEGKPSLV